MDNQENEALIQEMLRSAEKAEEPGDPNKVVHKGDEVQPAPMVRVDLKSAGYSYIYDTLTHERSVTNNNMLPMQLKKKRPDGSLVFTTIKPAELPKRGTLKCMLHPTDPNRTRYDVLGLPVCLKANLSSPFQVKRHMQKRHKMEWESLESERLEAEKERSIRLQESLILAVTGKVENQPEVYVADHPYKRKRGTP